MSAPLEPGSDGAAPSVVQASAPPARRSRARSGWRRHGAWVLGLAAAVGAFGLGRASVDPHPPVALAQQSAVVMQAVLENPGRSMAQLQQQLRVPLVGVLQRYAAAGYLVVEAGADGTGGYTLLAVPPGAIDITDELRAAVGLSVPGAGGRSAGGSGAGGRAATVVGTVQERP